LNGNVVGASHNKHTGGLSWQKSKRHDRCPILNMSFNGASMIFGCPSWVIEVAIGCSHSSTRYWLPSKSKIIVAGSLPNPENERQPSVKDF